MNVGTLEIQLMADVARIKRDMDQARQIVGNASQQMVEHLGAVRGGLESMMNPIRGLKAAFGPLLAAIGGLAMTDKIRGVITGMAELDAMAKRTGASVESLSALKGFAKATGTDMEAVAGGLAKMSKALVEAKAGAGPAAKAFAALKIDPQQFKTSEDAMLGIAKGIGGLKTGYEQVAAAQMFFGKNGATLLPTLLKMAEAGELNGKVTTQQAAQARQFEAAMAKLGGRFNDIYVSLASGLLPTLVKITNGFGAFVQIGAAYIAAFVIAPAVFSAAAAAITSIGASVAAARIAMAIGGPQALLFGASLGGITLPAEAAAGALGLLKIAAGVLFAAFAGWQIGTWLRDEFSEVRVAGLAFVGAMLTGWESVKYGAEMAWEGIKFAWDKSVGAMKSTFADYLSSVAKGLSFVGASDTAKQVSAYAESLRGAGADQKTFAERTAGITAAHQKSTAEIDKNIIELIQYEMSVKKVSKAAATGALDIKALGDGADKTAAAIAKELGAYQSIITPINEKIAANKLELSGYSQLSESQKLSIKLDEEIRSGKSKLNVEHVAAARAALVELAATEQLLKAQAAEKDVLAWIIQSTAARITSKDALAVEYVMYGKSADAREIAMVAMKAEADMLKDIAAIEAKNGKLTEEQIAQMKREKDMRVEVTQAALAQTKALNYASQLEVENVKFSAEYTVDPAARAAALLEIDAKMWRERIALAGDGTEAQKILQGEFTTWYANQGIKPMLDAERKLNEDRIAEQKKTIEQYDDIFRTGFSGMTNKGLSTWHSFETSLVTTFKTSVADQIYKMFAQPIIVKFVANMLGVTGSGSALAGSSSGSGSLLSAASDARTLYGIYDRGLAGLATSAGEAISAIGNMAGSASMSAYGAGMGMTTTGAADAASAYMQAAKLAADGYKLSTGELVASNTALADTYTATANALTSGAATSGSVNGAGAAASSSGWAAIGVAGLFAAAYAYLTSKGPKEVQSTGINGQFGAAAFEGQRVSNYTQDTVFNSHKGQDWAAMDAPTAKALSDSYMAIKVAAIGTARAIGLSAENIVGYEQQISVTFGKDEAANKAAIDSMFAGVGEGVAKAVLTGMSHTVEEVSSTSTVAWEKLVADGAGYALTVQGGVVKMLHDVSTTTGPDYSYVLKEGETYSQALQRLSTSLGSVNGMLDTLDVSLLDTSVAGAVMASKMVDLFGGADAMKATSSAYFSSYYSEQEKVDIGTRQLTKTFADLGFAMPAATEAGKAALRAQIEAALAGGEATQAAAVQLMQLAAPFATLTSASEQLSKSAADAATSTANTNKEVDHSAEVLDLQRQALEAMGDAAGAAKILEGQHTAALVDMAPALATATQALWDAQSAAKALGTQQSFRDAYLTPDQKLIDARKTLTAGFADLELPVPPDASAWLRLSDSLDSTDPAAQSLIETLKRLQPAFDTVQSAIATAAQKAIDDQKLIDDGKTASDTATANAAKANADALASTNKGWQDQIDTLLKAGMSAAQVRAMEIAGMDTSTVALYDLLHALQAESKVAEQRATLQDEFNALTDTAERAEKRRRDAIADGNLALYDSIQALKSAKTAQEELTAAWITARDGAKTATSDALVGVQRAVDAEKKRITVIRDAASESVNSIKGVFDTLKSSVTELYGTVSSTAAMQAQQGSQFIDQALANALSSGYLPDQKDLTDAIAAARGGLSSTEFATQFEADKAALVMAGKLSQLKDLAGPQLTTAERALSVANEQLTALDDQLLLAQRQVDAINGINNSVLSVSAALAALAAALAAQKAITSPAAAGGGDAGWSLPTGPSSSYSYDQAVAAGYTGPAVAPVQSAQEVAMQLAGVAGSALVNSLATIPELYAAAKEYHLPGFAAGGYYPGGLALVGEKGPELINFNQPGQVYTAPQTRNLMDGSGNTERLERLVEVLTEEVQRLQGVVADGNKNTGQLAEQFDNVTEGGNGIRQVFIEDRTK